MPQEPITRARNGSWPLRAWLIAFTLAMLGGAQAQVAPRAEDPTPFSAKVDGDFLQRVWETADGLMPTYVPSIAQTTDGYVWLAVFDNVVRFDGVRAKKFPDRATNGVLPVPVNGVFAHGDRSGGLWIGNADGRLFSMRDSLWREAGEADGWKPMRVVGVSEAPDGRIAFLGNEKLFIFDKGKFSGVTPPPQRKSAVDSSLRAVFTNTGVLIAATSAGLWRREGGEWKNLYAMDTPGWNASGMVRANDGGVWLASTSDIIHFDASGKVTRTIPRPEDFRSWAVELLEDSRGNLWAGGYRFGLCVWMADGRVIRPEHGREELHPQVTCLLEDRERNILVATAGAGLVRFKPQDFTTSLGRPGSIAGAQVNCVIEAAPGRVLAGTEGNGLFVIENGVAKKRILTADNSINIRERVTSLVKLEDGGVLAAIASKGLFRVTGDTAALVKSPPAVKGLVRAMFRDSKGTIWIGCEKGIFTWRDGAFSPVAEKNAPERVWHIAEDSAGRMWFSTRAGLTRLDAAGGLERIPIAGVNPNANILGLAAASGGGLWVGVENAGLIRLHDGAAPLILGKEQGMPVLSAAAIVEDAGMLWVAGEKGLVRLELASVEKFTVSKSARLGLRLFNRSDGLASDIFRRSYQPVAARAQDGRLWFATHKGVASLDPKRFTTPDYEVPALIEEIRAERELITVTPQNRGNITIPAGTRHMTIRCSMPTLSKPEFADFEYRLEGMDDRWHSSDSERVIRFYDIPPGTYRFLVRGIGSDGHPVEPPDSVTLNVMPFFWQTQWYRMIKIATIAIVVALLAWIAFHRRLAQQKLKLAQQEERARLEAELQQTKRAEVIGRLAGGIAHDFNNILAAILGNAELARLEHGKNEDLREMLDSILSAGERARDLIVQILSYSRQRRTDPVPLDIAPALQESLKLLRSGTPATVEFVTEIPQSLPLVRADATEVQRILMNLGTNAAQAMGATGGRIFISAREVFGGDDSRPEIPRGRAVCLRVEDNGTGMDDQTLQRIFDPFFTTKEHGKGTGLGLAVVKGIIESLNGVITVDSKPDAGTTFRVFFPVITGSSVWRVAKPAAQPLISDHAERILLADDEAQVLSVARRTLESLGYEVSAHRSALAALAEFEAKPKYWQLVITDFAMPGMNGVEFARHIRARRRDIPIILCTGFGGAVDAAAAKAIGISRVINKPFRRQQFSETVAEVLGKSAAPGK
ncbi:MAG: two-component regulator propeller domain-containing protein [Chthoniobacteraceae bacterium]